MSDTYDALKRYEEEREREREQTELARNSGSGRDRPPPPENYPYAEREREQTELARNSGSGRDRPPPPENYPYADEHGFREGLQALYRRKGLILSTFLVTALAVGAAFFLRGTSYEAVCLVAVKKPSQLFVPTGTSIVASVPLLEGQTYKDVMETAGFAKRVALRLSAEEVEIDADEIRQRVRAKFLEPDLLRIRARYPESSVAIVIANAACQTLVDFNRTELQEQLKAQVATISGLLKDVGDEITRTQLNIAQFMQREGLVNVDLNSTSSDVFQILQILSQHEIAKAKEEAALRAAEQQLGRLTKTASTTSNGSVVEDPAVTTLRSQLETARVKFWEARGEFTESHPIVRRFGNQITDLQRELDRHLWNGHTPPKSRLSPEHELAIRQKITATSEEIVNRKAQIAAWSQLINDTRRTLGIVPGQKAGLDPLRSTLVFAEESYRDLSRRLQETRISYESVKGSVSLVQRAVEPEPPDLLQLILIAILLALHGSIRSWLAGGIHGRLDAKPRRRPPRDRLPMPGHHYQVAVFPFPRGFVQTSSSGGDLEPFRILRSTVRFTIRRIFPGRLRSLAPDAKRDGPPWFFISQRCFVRIRSESFLVDADLRSRSLARALGIESTRGLVEVVMGERTLDEALQTTALANVMLLPAMAAGRSLPANPEMLFRGPEFQRAFDGALREIRRRPF